MLVAVTKRVAFVVAAAAQHRSRWPRCFLPGHVLLLFQFATGFAARRFIRPVLVSGESRGGFGNGLELTDGLLAEQHRDKGTERHHDEDRAKKDRR